MVNKKQASQIASSDANKTSASMPDKARAPLAHDASYQRRARPRSARFAAKHSPFCNLLTAHQRRRAFSETSGEFNNLLALERSTAKSVKVFRVEVRGILHGIFFVLLLRFLLVLLAAVVTLGFAVVLIIMIKEPHVSLTNYLNSIRERL
ncbi:unnamed protein product [Peronospora farinosa]|uniref:Uncharacterized protein n=1 Tax=Peronospora farinosa TaxID=134698 RepID=A0AAV0TA27_9STRA|nr:unnamed protein product [Peronospora farinosa]CAI5715557.1 unnamed protein product [Peronospora farinosa]